MIFLCKSSVKKKSASISVLTIDGSEELLLKKCVHH